MSDALELLTAHGLDIYHSAPDSLVFGENNLPCCQIRSGDGAVVSEILLQMAPKVLLGDVIARYGEPAYVTGLPFSDSEYALVLLYPERGLFLYAFVSGEDAPLETISPIITALLTTPEHLAAITDQTPLDRWQGYLSFQRLHGWRVRSLARRARLMSGFQLAADIVQADIQRRHQRQQVIQQIRAFADLLVPALRQRRHDDFRRFFAQLLRQPVLSLRE